MEDKTRKKDDVIRRLLTFTVPELCDGAGEYRVMDYRIKPQSGRTRIVGPAVTVDVPAGEGGIVAQAIHCLHPGDILVTAGKTGEGEINIPVICGGVEVAPGDLIAGDVNGIIVIRPDEAEDIMERALKKRLAQEKVLTRMRQTGEIITKIRMD